MTGDAEEPWAGLCIAEPLPFDFRADEGPPSPEWLAQADATNLQTLVVDASLGEARRGLESAEHETNRQMDLERLECKLDVLLGLVARMATREGAPGAAASVRLFAEGLEWRAAGAPPATGVRGVVRLQINPAFPQPLVLTGVVDGLRRDPECDWVQFRFEGMGARVMELLERLIFRRHRRQVAGSHGHGHGPGGG